MMKYKPSGKLIIAGVAIPTDAPIVNFQDAPYWDATKEFCIPTETERAPPCLPGGVPYGKLPMGPYTRRYSTRPALQEPKKP